MASGKALLHSIWALCTVMLYNHVKKRFAFYSSNPSHVFRHRVLQSTSPSQFTCQYILLPVLRLTCLPHLDWLSREQLLYQKYLPDTPVLFLNKSFHSAFKGSSMQLGTLMPLLMASKLQRRKSSSQPGGTD